MKNNISKLYTILFFLLTSFISFAQPGDTDGTPGGLEGNDPVAPAPIGDHLWILTLLGILFVFLAFRVMNKKEIQE